MRERVVNREKLAEVLLSKIQTNWVCLRENDGIITITQLSDEAYEELQQANNGFAKDEKEE